MEGNNPKISFIPKGSLVREESFLERRRPRSALGFIAGIAFVSVVGAYAGLYYHNDILNQEVAAKTIEIKSAQKEFIDNTEVSGAKVFRARALLARKLLNTHGVVSPLFAFLSKNTTESVLYDKFSFRRGSDGATLELSGEAPTYSALAYQSDIFRNQTKDLSSFLVRDVSLTKYGTVTFTLVMAFSPDYLSYVNNVSSFDVPTLQADVSVATTTIINLKAPIVTPPAFEASIESPVSATEPDSIPPTRDGNTASDQTAGERDVATTPTVTEKQSFLMSLWSKLKFW